LREYNDRDATSCHNIAISVIRINEQKNGMQNFDKVFVRSFCTRRLAMKSKRVTLKQNLIFELHIRSIDPYALARFPCSRCHRFARADDKVLFFYRRGKLNALATATAS